MFCDSHPDLGLLLASAVPVLDPASPNAAAIQHIFLVVFLICCAVFVAVSALIVVSVVRFRGDSTPLQDFGRRRSEVVWAIPPVLIVVGLSAVSAKLILSILAMPTSRVSEAGSADLVVVGHQWWWEVRYLDPGVVTANEIHIPVGRKLRVRVEAADVIHSFWVPQLGPKMDMIPGHPNYVWLEADRAGVYDGACAEFCGDQHAWMRFAVVAEPLPQYQAWLTRQAQPAAAPAGDVAGRGRRFFFAETCANCHAIKGTSAIANAAPDLTHLASRTELAAGRIANNPQNLARWLRNPQQFKPGCQMPNFSSQRRRAVATRRLHGGPAMTAGAFVKPQPDERELPAESSLLGWFSSVDHKQIGILYICTALVFLLIGGAEAIAIRVQLVVPNNTLIGPSFFNQLFTMHGTTMVFLVGMPILTGFANYLVPLMIGARDVAFPRLNAFGFWLVPLGGILLHYSFLTGIGSERRLVQLRAAERTSLFVAAGC